MASSSNKSAKRRAGQAMSSSGRNTTASLKAAGMIGNGLSKAMRKTTKTMGLFSKVFGPELFSGTFDTAVTLPWVEGPTGTWTCDGTQGGDVDLKASAAETGYISGVAAETTFEIVSISGGTFKLYANTNGPANYTTVGQKSIAAEQVNGNNFIFRATAGVSVVIRAISKKQTTL